MLNLNFYCALSIEIPATAHMLDISFFWWSNIDIMHKE